MDDQNTGPPAGNGIVVDDVTLKGGLSYRGFSNSGYQQATDDLNKPAWEKGTLDDTVTSYAKVFSQHKDQSWINIDWDKALAQAGLKL